jgi:hypothetical protein
MVLFSCEFDIGALNLSMNNSNVNFNAFKEVDFLAEANPLVFGVSSSTGNDSITRGGNTGGYWKDEPIPEGMIEVRSVSGSGKIAGSEDGLAFYFKEVDIGKNFIMEADFTVKSFGSRPNNPTITDRTIVGTKNDTELGSNGQEGWGIMVRDFVPQLPRYTTEEIKAKELALDTQDSTAYRSGSGNGDSNMILAGGVKRGARVYWREGIKWNREIPLTGETSGNPTANAYQDSGNFRFGFQPKELGDYSIYTADNGTPSLAARPDYPQWGSTYRVRLEKTNNGYNYTITAPPEKAVPPETGTVPLYDIADSINKEKYYVGLFAARDACVWVSNIKYYEADAADCAPYVPVLPTPLAPAVEVVSPIIYTGAEYLYITANMRGQIAVTQNGKTIPSSVIFNDWIVEKENGSAKPLTLFTVPTYPHKEGDNVFSIAFTPDTTLAAELVNAGYALDSTSVIKKTFTVTRKMYAGGTGDIYVSPQGTPFGSGGSGSPLDLQTAINYAQPGQTVILKNGVYLMDRLFVIPRYNSGRFDAPKTLKAEERDKVFFDWNKNPVLANKSQGFLLEGNYWVLDGFHIRNTPDKTKGIVVGGHNNTIRWITIHSNGDTGLQISGNSAEPKVFWPSGNTIEYCESFNNKDGAEIDADGFAAKLTVGKDNVFKWCISHNNCDDGWDLFSKKDTGSIGIVQFYNCISYENGTLLDGYNTKGGKNGFKLGGEGISTRHEVYECLSFRNGGNAFTSNSNPSIDVFNSTAINTAGSGLGVINIYAGDSSGANGTINRCVYSGSGGVTGFEFEQFLVEKEINGVRYKKFIDRDQNGKPILKNVYKPDTAGQGAWVFYN